MILGKKRGRIIEAAVKKVLHTCEKGERIYGPKLDFMVKDALGVKCSWLSSKLDYNFQSVLNLNI